jgi:hypothetical protein
MNVKLRFCIIEISIREYRVFIITVLESVIHADKAFIKTSYLGLLSHGNTYRLSKTISQKSNY